MAFIFAILLLTLTRPIPEKIQGAPGRFPSALPVPVLRRSDSLCDELPHPVGGILSHLLGNVGVGVQGEPRAVVAQDAGDRFDIHPLLDRQGGEGVPQPVEGDALGDPGLPSVPSALPSTSGSKRAPPQRRTEAPTPGFTQAATRSSGGAQTASQGPTWGFPLQGCCL